MRFLIAFLMLAAPFTTPAMAADCPVPYSEFEENIPHIDMAECPNNKPDSELGFCRLVMDGDDGYIYAFLYTDDEPCLFDTYRAKKSDYLMKK
jgi:hypothetical protein